VTEIPYRGALEIAAAIRNKRLSATQYLEYILSRIEEYDPALNSVITLNTDAALTAARAADQAVTDGTVLGPLHGVPFGLKDIIDAAHLPTTAHSRIYVNNTPIEDAAVTEYLKQSGAILLAKLATHNLHLADQVLTYPGRLPETHGTRACLPAVRPAAAAPRLPLD